MPFFSSDPIGFWDEQNDQSKIPVGSVEISEEQRAALLAGEFAGKIIQADKKGFPILVDPAPPTAEELIQVAFAKRDALLAYAAIRIAPLQDAADIGVETEDEKDLLLKWKRYRVGLNRLQDQAGFPAEIEWPESPEELDGTVA